MRSPVRLSPGRILAVFIKEMLQLRRDRPTFAMMVGIPILQLVLFSYAINMDPKHLPTALLMEDASPLTRALAAAIVNTDYFRVIAEPAGEEEAEALLRSGRVSFVFTLRPGFTRDALAGRRPQLLVEADASDPAAAANALAALEPLLARALRDGLAAMGEVPPPRDDLVELVLHRRYNPEAITQYNIVPGLLGVVLTLSMVLMTAISLTREIERGTMENLLAMPLEPLEVMIGKILPSIGIGTVQVLIILAAAAALFRVPFLGGYGVLSASLFLFVAGNLTLGYLISTLARNQMQAMQMTFFFFLPSILLSGFMFPFRGMPPWAQALGEALPLTHMLRIVRGTMLKGAGLGDLAGEVLALAAFLAIIAALALLRYRRTLD